MVTPEQVESGVLRQRETGLRIGETLVDQGAVTEEDVGWALSRQLGLTFVDLDPEALDPALVRSFPESLLRRSDAVPLLSTDAGLSIALADPTDTLALDRLEAAAGVPLLPVIGTPTAIRHALDHVLGPRRSAPEAHPEHATTDGARRFDVVWERSGDTFLAFHLSSALRQGSRELHFLPADGALHVHYRDGDRLVEAAVEPARLLDALLARIEALGGPAPGGGLHARGRLRCPLPLREVEVDASLLTTREGTHVTLVVRAGADEAGMPPTLESLGVDPGDAAELRAVLAEGTGLVLVGGPPEAGGSTLLRALAAPASGPGRRTLVFERASAEGSLPGATRVSLAAPDAAAAWPAIAVAQRADVVLLDGVLEGAAIAGVLDGAAAGRLVLVRHEACDTASLLDRLLAVPGARPTLAGRLRAVLQVRRVRSEPRHLVETLVLGEPLRAALEDDGTDGARLMTLAAEVGFRTLAARGAARVAAGTLGADELRRARS